jgi:hypothetical protein
LTNWDMGDMKRNKNGFPNKAKKKIEFGEG